MYDIFLVANYIISQCNKLEIKITHTILQNLLFLVQKESVTAYNHPCFAGDFYALDSGPLNLEINREYFSYHSRNLPESICSDFCFSKQDQYIIDSIISEYAEYGEGKIMSEICADELFLEARKRSSQDYTEIIDFSTTK